MSSAPLHAYSHHQLGWLEHIKELTARIYVTCLKVWLSHGDVNCMVALCLKQVTLRSGN